ncbi:MAG: D-alanine--D-alanine ligase [Tissierellia bacterium]|nr:D-alanine--D-alanine ligase [Tissierellia bacterium]
MKKKIALLFGGRSEEHPVSIVGARELLKIDEVTDQYEFILIGIDKKGKMRLLEEFPKEKELNFQGEKKVGPEILEALYAVDYAFALLHGPYGEDGKIQGFFETLGIKYFGCDVLTSALLMDKDMAKIIMASGGIPVVPWITLREKDDFPTVEYPVFVKPANLGSSIGVSKAKNEQELRQALQVAFSFDAKVLIEESIQGRELECSLLGSEVSGVGEIIPAQEFYTYEAKYEDERSHVILPAQIPREVEEKIRHYTKRAGELFSIKDLSRVDFFYSKDGLLYLNEVNTMPGCTPISMYTKLWKAMGISVLDILDRWTHEVEGEE